MIILAIVLVSGLLGFWQERGAADAVQKLLAVVQIKATCERDGKPVDVHTDEVVPGDIVVLHAGDIVPADCLILESKDLFVNEAALTGETFPVEKSVATLPPDTPLAKRTNSLFLGTNVVSGTAKAVAVLTGRATEFGKVSQTLTRKPPETEFERGIRHFGYLLMEVTLLLVLGIFAANVYFHRPVLESLLFSLALAVGLTPQLLPAIISINLAHGAKRMAEEKVIVKRLAAIENFGSMDVLCTDKTGTLTEGTVRLHSAVDVGGEDSDKVLLFAFLNAKFQSGYANPIDEAIVGFRPLDVSGYTKLDEEPYDFVRKRLSVLVANGGKHLMVTKGALANVLDVCQTAETADGEAVPLDPLRAQIQTQYEAFSGQGYRTLGIAYRDLGTETKIGKDHEAADDVSRLSDPVRPAPIRHRPIAPIPARSRRLAQADHGRQRPRRRDRQQAGGADQPADRHGRRPAPDEPGSADPARAFRGRLRGSGAEPERTHHPGAEEGGPCRRLHGGRDQRRLRPPRRRCRHLRGKRRGCRQRSGGHRAAGKGPGRAGARRPGRPDHVRQHAQIRLHGDQRQLRQHVQHGRRVPVPLVPAAPAQADPADEPDDRLPGNDHRHGQRGPGIGDVARAAGTSSSSGGSWSSSAW